MNKLSVKDGVGSENRKIGYLEPNERIPPAYQVLPPKFRELYQPIQDLNVYDDDVWIVTFPKSGTHWMQDILCTLLHGVDFNTLSSKDYKKSVNVEVECFTFSKDVPQHKLNYLSKFHETLERPRVMKTHLFWGNLPKALRDPNCKAKIVYVARNPKDVFESLFYHYQMLHGDHETSMSSEDFANEFLNDRIGFSPYWNHVYDFWARRNNPKILYVYYEEMKADFPKVLDKLQLFLNLKPLTVVEKQKIAENLSFEKMERQVNEEKIPMTLEISKKFDVWIYENSTMHGYEEYERSSFCKL